MKTIMVPRSKFGRGNYAEHVVSNGHVPGVLSGAELRGKASEYGTWYAKKREEVIHDIYMAADVEVGYLKYNRKVWVDSAGNPVELDIDYDN